MKVNDLIESQITSPIVSIAYSCYKKEFIPKFRLFLRQDGSICYYEPLNRAASRWIDENYMHLVLTIHPNFYDIKPPFASILKLDAARSR